MGKNDEEKQLKEAFDKHPEEFKKIGFLFYVLIRIENNLNMLIEIFFCEFNQIKNLIFNEALLDEKIFPTLENKRKFLLKIIQYLNEEAKNKKLNFSEKKWKEICNSIKKFQEIRNDLAHKFLSFSTDNIASYISRKNLSKIKEEKEQGKKYEPFAITEIDLDNELEKAEQVFQDSKKLLTEFLEEAFQIIHS